MRCLVVADLHYSLPQFDWLLAAAPEFDVVIFAGDALDIGSFVDFRAQILVAEEIFVAAVGHDTGNLLLGQSRPRRPQRRRREDRALGSARCASSASPATVTTSRSATSLFTVCPWWDGPLVKQRLD